MNKIGHIWKQIDTWKDVSDALDFERKAYLSYFCLLWQGTFLLKTLIVTSREMVICISY